MKFFLCLFFLATSSFANDKMIPMTVKERLRLSLWSEGLAPKKKIQFNREHKKLPEEIEKPLRKL